MHTCREKALRGRGGSPLDSMPMASSQNGVPEYPVRKLAEAPTMSPPATEPTRARKKRSKVVGPRMLRRPERFLWGGSSPEHALHPVLLQVRTGDPNSSRATRLSTWIGSVVAAG